jgi:hypothetical protein
MSDQRSEGEGGVCLTGMEARERGVETLALSPDPPPADYLEAMSIADRAAAARRGSFRCRPTAPCRASGRAPPRRWPPPVISPGPFIAIRWLSTTVMGDQQVLRS